MQTLRRSFVLQIPSQQELFTRSRTNVQIRLKMSNQRHLGIRVPEFWVRNADANETRRHFLTDSGKQTPWLLYIIMFRSSKRN